MTADLDKPKSAAPTRQQASQLRWKIVFVALVVAIPVIIVAWIVSSPGRPQSAPTASCQAVTATLANGPDPDVDPVGYAEAQVRPLREITTSDAELRSAIIQLSSAYESFYKNSGSALSKNLVSAADKNVDRYCPGATA